MSKKKILFITIICIGLIVVALIDFGGEASPLPVKTVTVEKNVTVTENVVKTVYGNRTETVTATQTQTATKTVNRPVNVTVTMTATKTVPAYTNNSAPQIKGILLDKLNNWRMSHDLPKLVENTELNNYAMYGQIPWEATAHTDQLFALFPYNYDRIEDECWRGDLYVAEMVLNSLLDEYGLVLSNPKVFAVGIYVGVDNYEINVRVVLMGS